MGLISNLILFFADLSDFFSCMRDLFGALPFAIRMLVYFVFGSIMLFGILKMVLRMGGS